MKRGTFENDGLVKKQRKKFLRKKERLIDQELSTLDQPSAEKSDYVSFYERKRVVGCSIEFPSYRKLYRWIDSGGI